MIAYLLFGISLAQTCSQIDNITFETCKSNLLVDENGQAGASSPATACAALQSQDLYDYYKCLCDRSGSLVYCYDSFCQADVSLATWQASQKSYCDAAETYRPPGVDVPSSPQPVPNFPASSTTSENSEMITPGGFVQEESGAMKLTVMVVSLGLVFSAFL